MAKRRDPEKVVREIKRKTRRKFSSEEKIRPIPWCGLPPFGPATRKRSSSGRHDICKQ